MDFFTYDFGYAWPWTYGHLIPIAAFGVLLLIGWRRGWRAWVMVLLSIPALWGLAGLWIVHAELNFTRPVKLPTEQFLADGSGVVLDAGAGSGRSSLMVLQARPGTRVIALDIFNDEYGIEANTPERLMRNAEQAGVSDRIEIKTGDMRSIPLEKDSLEGAVSAYAIDHLPEEGIVQALSELDRTIKSGGDLLILTINADRYIRIAYPMMAEHGYFGRKDANLLWTRRLRDAGFRIVEIGTTPGTMYFLARAR